MSLNEKLASERAARDKGRMRFLARYLLSSLVVLPSIGLAIFVLIYGGISFVRMDLSIFAQLRDEFSWTGARAVILIDLLFSLLFATITKEVI